MGQARIIGTGCGKFWYEIAGTVVAGWKFDAANKDQYERLLVDTYAGLCEVQGRRGQTCAALDACQAWTRLRKKAGSA